MANSSVSGTLYTISAPSGAGKTSLVKQLVENDPQLYVSVSHTTRTPRSGEVNGVNYHFIKQSQFSEMVGANEFLEHATVFENSYGTSKQQVFDQLNQGKDVILEIDWQGAEQTKAGLVNSAGEQNIHCVSIFILPPSLDALKQRLTGRGQDGEEVINKRMAEAVNEISHYEQADFLIINDQFAQALLDLQTVISAQRLHLSKQKQRFSAMISELLG